MDPAPQLLPVDWEAPPGVRACTTGRAGGKSRAPYASLNLGGHVGDDPDDVADNRRRMELAAGLPAAPRWLRQVHGTSVAFLDSLPPEDVPVADGAVAARVGVVCAVMTADCLPVLLAARDGSAVAAAHAGWRGLAAGILETTIAMLRTQAAAGVELQAWLGPAIGPQWFEVGEEVRAQFLGHDAAAQDAFSRSQQGRWLADLHALARRRLLAAGIERISGGAYCTYAEEDRFFSHRRDVQHRALDGTGRMATLVWKQT